MIYMIVYVCIHIDGLNMKLERLGKKKHTLKRKQVILKSTTQLLGHLLVEGRIWPAANCARCEAARW